MNLLADIAWAAWLTLCGRLVDLARAGLVDVDQAAWSTQRPEADSVLAPAGRSA
ncbi:hypothetical protein [Dactylosporangium cerinum]